MRSRRRLFAELLEDRQLLSGFPSPTPLSFTGNQAVILRAASLDVTYYSLSLTEASRVTATVATGVGDTRLSLLKGDGTLLAQSDGLSLSNRDDRIEMHLPGSASGTTYLLRLEGINSVLSSGTLTVDVASALPPWMHLPTGSGSLSKVGDVNNDGLLDVVTANYNTAEVSVLLGRGDGTFTRELRLAVGAGPSDVVLADLDGDGHVDLATANLEDASLSILKGRGDGTFVPAIRLAVGQAPSSVTAADFNHDGIADLVYSDFATNEVAVLPGLGSGQFGMPLSQAVGEAPYYLRVGDVNEDGRLDVVTANSTSNDVSVLLGDGTGSFAGGRLTLPVGLNPYTLTLTDVDRDGHLDVLSANVGSNDISICFGTGTGAFASEVRIPTGLAASQVATGDLNEDGHVDLVVTNWDEGTLSVLLGQPGRRFASQRLLRVGSSPAFIDLVDVNRDGHLDVVHSSYSGGFVSVGLGRGDGTFLMPTATPQGEGTTAVLTGDLNRDGLPDVVTINYGPGDVMVMLGRADGTFLQYLRYKNGTDPTTGALADVTGDGILDLILCNVSTNNVSLSAGLGDGSFGTPTFFDTGSIPTSAAVGDFDHDGWLDLVVGNRGDSSLTLLLSDGQGSWRPGVTLAVGDGPVSVVQGDFNRDGHLDVASADSRSGTVSVLSGNGDGTFAPGIALAAGVTPTTLVTGDFNADGVPDLAVTNYGADTVSVFLGDETQPSGFRPLTTVQAGAGAYGLAVGHFNGDASLDLATSNRAGNTISWLFNNGAGTFSIGGSSPTGLAPMLLATADFNRDGRDDLVVPNNDSSDLMVYLGGALGQPIPTPIANVAGGVSMTDFNGDGFTDGVGSSPLLNVVSVGLGAGDVLLAPESYFPLADGPSGVATGDFNGDGRMDFAVAAMRGAKVTTYFGRGDATFSLGASFAVGQRPLALVAADFDGDGLLDLATANDSSGDVSVLLGRGDGTFRPQRRYATGAGARMLAVADFNQDGRLDLVCGNEIGHSLTILYGQRPGGFVTQTVALAGPPRALAVGDVDQDGRVDVAYVSQSDGFAKVLLNRAGGFVSGQSLAVGAGPISVALQDLNRDGKVDLAVAQHYANSVYLALGQGDGTFQAIAPVPTGSYPTDLVAMDLTRDTRPDLFNVNSQGSVMTVNLGHGDGTFADQSLTAYPVRGTPIAADFNGDGLVDVAILQQKGSILLRKGEGSGSFAPPQVVNDDDCLRARDLALVRIGGRAGLVAAETQCDALTLYAWNRATGSLQVSAVLAVPDPMPVRVLVGDVNADGRDDILAATATGKVFVWLQSAAGTFDRPAYAIDVGVAPLDLVLLPHEEGDHPDVAVLDAISGDVRLLVNDPVAPFTQQLRFRAGTSTAVEVEAFGRQFVSSRDRSVAMVAGQFAGDHNADLIVVNQEAHQLTSLLGTHHGLLNPVSSPAMATGSQPVAIVAGDFNGDGIQDVVVLDAGDTALTTYLGSGAGYVVKRAATSAGNAPAGMVTTDLNGDGKLDLLVGNSLGDVLTLFGNGDGTFQPYRRIGGRLALAVADLNGDGHDDFVFANQALDRVAVQYSDRQEFTRDRQQGILDPGRVKVADLNGDRLPELIVVNGGGNNVLVYPGIIGGQFGSPQSFFAGTNPVGVTISDLNRDGKLDLVLANEGSNDVSVLLGSGAGGQWTLRPGPRLQVGAGPVATLVRDLNGDGILDILVSNAQSNTVSLLRGVGGGFFNDRDAIVLPTGLRPSDLFVGEFDDHPGLDLITLDTGSHEVSFFPNLSPDRHALPVGMMPVAFLGGDFNDDGRADLVVVSQQDNLLSLFLGGANGPEFAATLNGNSLSRPSDVALASAGGGSLEVYVLLENQEVARLTFVFEAGEVRLVNDEPVTAGRPSSDFSSLGRSLLEGVTTLSLGHGDDDATAPAQAGRILLAGLDSALPEMPASGGGETLEEDEGDDLPFATAVAAREGLTLPGGAGRDGGPSADEVDLNTFVLGVDELPFARRLQTELARQRDEAPPDLDALDTLFRIWETPALPEAALPPLDVEKITADADEEDTREESPDVALLESSAVVMFLAPYALALTARRAKRTRRWPA